MAMEAKENVMCVSFGWNDKLFVHQWYDLFIAQNNITKRLLGIEPWYLTLFIFRLRICNEQVAKIC